MQVFSKAASSLIYSVKWPLETINISRRELTLPYHSRWNHFMSDFMNNASKIKEKYKKCKSVEV